MLIIRGMKVSPAKIESLLFEIEGEEPNYRVVIDRKGAMDEVTVLVEAAGEASYGQERRHVGTTVETIRKRLTHELGVTVDVKLVEKRNLEPIDGKTVRVTLYGAVVREAGRAGPSLTEFSVICPD